MRNTKIYLFGIVLLIFTVFLSVKTYEGFQSNVDCSRLTDCKVCANTMGCTYCKSAKKCVANRDEQASCPEDTYFNSAEDCADCINITNAKTCAGTDPCAWCKTSNKCVFSSDTRRLCPGESIALDARAVDKTNSTDASGMYFRNGRVVDASNNIPYSFNVNDSINALRDQLDSGVYDSETSDSTKGLDFVTKLDSSTSDYTRSFDSDESSFDYSNISSQYPGTSVIPILGLSRDINGHLTSNSLKTVVQAAKNSGYTLNTTDSKQKLMDDIQKENNFYVTQKKSYMKKFLDNSIEYVNDNESLKKVKEIDIKIMDLNDISGYVKGINTKAFTEGYGNYKDQFLEFTVTKNKGVEGYLKFLWIANFIAIGTFVYFINK